MTLDTWIAEEIDRLRRRFAPLLREVPETREAPAQWTVAPDALLWHVVLEDVVEPDIDIEIRPPLLVVRARPQRPRPRMLLALLPVPSGFEVDRPYVRCEIGYMEIRVHRATAGGRRP